MSQTAIALIPVLAFSLGLLTSLATFYIWLSQSVRKRYAAERDFQHLKASQAAMQQMLIALDDSIDELKKEFIRYSERQK